MSYFVPNAHSETDTSAWFCLRSQPKHEHIAAAHLRQEGIEAFSPRIRLKRKTQNGPKWFTEALFPNYLFAKFQWQADFKKVKYVRGVSTVIHFGDKWPTIPEVEIEELRSKFGDAEIRVINPNLKEGDSVEISTGAFQGLSGIIMQAASGKERVKVLLDFLGRQITVEIAADILVEQGSPRQNLWVTESLNKV